MSEELTDVETTPDGQGNNDVSTEGDGSTTSKTGVEKKFSQQDIDAIIKRKQAEWRDKSKRDFEKSLEGKLVLTETELHEKVNAALDDYRKEQTLVAVRQTIKNDFGLTDDQIARLTGDTEKALREDAEKIFGVLKKKEAPKLRAGGGGTTVTETTVVDRLRSKLRSDLKEK
jgi:hypothetical protein